MQSPFVITRSFVLENTNQITFIFRKPSTSSTAAAAVKKQEDDIDTLRKELENAGDNFWYVSSIIAVICAFWPPQIFTRCNS